MNDIPDYTAVRGNILPVIKMFENLVPQWQIVDIQETIRLMLADFFYADLPSTHCNVIQSGERRIALNIGMWPDEENVQMMLESVSDVFWTLADFITGNFLTVRTGRDDACVCRPHETFYVYDANHSELLVYIPSLPQYAIPGAALVDGRAVLSATRATWPSFLINAISQNPKS